MNDNQLWEIEIMKTLTDKIQLQILSLESLLRQRKESRYQPMINPKHPIDKWLVLMHLNNQLKQTIH